MQTKFTLLLLIVVVTSCGILPIKTSDARLRYNSTTAKECPKPSETDRYIDVPVFYDLEKFGAVTSRVPGLSLHKELRGFYEGKNYSVYYELDRPFDPTKEIFFFLNGGPGGDHEILHVFKKLFPYVYEAYNVVTMDHRGIGCSGSRLPGSNDEALPNQSLMMRYAASDVESIRIALGGADAKLTVWGGSYGSMLAQTYALLYPQHLQNLILASAFSASADYSEAQRIYVSLVESLSPQVADKIRDLRTRYPDHYPRFMQWAVGPMYSLQGRIKNIPETLEKYLKLISEDQIDDAKKLTIPQRFVMPAMTRAIGCLEIFRPDVLYPDEFMMFPSNFSTCKEFEGEYEYFDYTESLKNISTHTLLVSGVLDHVTPFNAMLRMSQKLPNNYMHVDRNLGHDAISQKPSCINALYEGFLSGLPDSKLQEISTSETCGEVPYL